MTGISQQFCVRWNSHLGSLGAAFPQLLAGQQFVDVTLACDGHQVHCHRLVLAACSSYFESLLSENPCKHPIIILPKDIKLWEIHALVDFMYKGQVNVSQAGLPELLKCAETLQIRGLCGTESSLNEVANGKIDGRCDSNVLASNCSPNFNFTSMFASNLMNANYQSDDEQTFRQQHSDMQQRSMFLAADIAKARSNETIAKTKPHKNAHTDKATKEPCNATLSSTKNIMKRLSENEASNTCSSELNIKCEDVDSDPNAADDGIDDELDEHSNSKQSEYAMANVVCEYANDSPPRLASAAAGSLNLEDTHPDYGRSMSPPAKRFAGDSSYYAGMSEPGRRIRRSESLLRQAADNVSKGQTFQTVSDMFQIPISTIRFFMARKGILPRRKRGRASTASTEVDDANGSPHNRQQGSLDIDTFNNTTNIASTEQP